MAALSWLTARPIAHRGYHDAATRRIENTLPAAEAAIARGFAIECDLQPTSDGEVVVFHDDTLERLTDLTGPVAKQPLAVLRKARIKDSGAQIPTLEELLDLVDGRVPLIIELKSRFDGDRRLEAATAAVLAAYTGPAAVMSFDPAALIAMRQFAPMLPRGMLADRFLTADWPGLPLATRFTARHMLAAPMVMPSFVAYDVNALPTSVPLALRHFFRLPLLAWTIRTPEQRRVARAWADQIIFEGFDPDTG